MPLLVSFSQTQGFNRQDEMYIYGYSTYVTTYYTEKYTPSKDGRKGTLTEGQGQRGSVVSNNQKKVWYWEGRDQTVEENCSFLCNLP